MNFWDFLSRHWGKIIGGLAGLIIALMMIHYGVLKSLIIFAFIALGIVIGWRLDLDENIRRYFERLFSSRDDF
ncbi:MAG TPA: DUF2273 domain-containing protein [Firmicutes bacterium]|nr:DUF2273 domain-containing protein [Bacillota bacterium]